MASALPEVGVTVEPVKFIVPKFVSGRMPPKNVQHGASAMTSAEERFAPFPAHVRRR